MPKPIQLRAGTAVLAAAAGILVAVFAVVPAASAHGRSTNSSDLRREVSNGSHVQSVKSNGSHVRGLKVAANSTGACHGYYEYSADSDDYEDSWVQYCDVADGQHAQGVTKCRSENGHTYYVYGPTWHDNGNDVKFYGQCDWDSQHGHYDDLVDFGGYVEFS